MLDLMHYQFAKAFEYVKTWVTVCVLCVSLLLKTMQMGGKYSLIYMNSLTTYECLGHKEQEINNFIKPLLLLNEYIVDFLHL